MVREKIAPLLLKLYKPAVMKYLQQIRKLYIKEENVKNYQLFRLRKLLLHAYKNTEYYHKIFDDIGLIREDKINWTAFPKIPVLNKQIIRKHFNDLLAKDHKQRGPYQNTSGGSTGEPVIFIQDRDYMDRMVADTLYFGEIAGKQLGEKEVKIWGSEKDLFHERKSVFNRLVTFFFNRILLNSFQLSPVLIDNYLEVINEVKPKMIWTYVDSIFEIAKYINRNQITKIYQPESIVCTAGTMYPELKEEIMKAFPKTGLYNQYGSREVGIIGIGKEKIKIFRQSVFLELFDKSAGQYITGQGAGNVIVTALNNYSMPLIKYDIGDIGESSEIEETSVKALDKLNGRENSHIIKRDGSIIHGELFTHLFYFIQSIKKFQVIQEDYEKFLINIEVSKEGIDNRDLENIRNKINQIMNVSCEIDFNIIDKLPKLKSGKYLFVFSKVQYEKS